MVADFIRETVAEITERSDLDPSVDLFDQGVTSLSFVRVVARANERFDIAIDLGELEEASVDELSALVDTQIRTSRTQD